MGCGSCGSRYRGFTHNTKLRKLQRRRPTRPVVRAPIPVVKAGTVEELKPAENLKNE